MVTKQGQIESVLDPVEYPVKGSVV
jgi:hypothetical protein